MNERRRDFRDIAIAATTAAALTFACADKENPTQIEPTNNNTIYVATAIPESRPVAPTPEILPTVSHTESDIRRTDGEWSRTDARALTDSMLSETEYGDIYHAGQLIEGIIEGKPNFSTKNPIFQDADYSDDTNTNYRIETVSENEGFLVNSILVLSGKEIAVKMAPLNGEEFEAPSVTNLRLKSLRINSSHTDSLSDFGMKFYIATQMKLPEAFKVINDNLNIFSLSGEYSEDQNNAKEIYELLNFNYFEENSTNNLPASHVAAYGAQFLMIPTFAQALENGEFSTTDLEKLGFLSDASKELIEKNVIAKNSDGKYTWKNDYSLFMNALLKYSFERADASKIESRERQNIY